MEEHPQASDPSWRTWENYRPLYPDQIMELNQQYKPVIETMLAEYRDKPITKGIAFKLHMELVLYGTKNFPELTNEEVNNQARAIVTQIVKEFGKCQ